MSIHDEVLAANDEDAARFGAMGEFALPPARHFAKEYDRALHPPIPPIPPKTLPQRFGVWMKWNLADLLAGAFVFLYEHLLRDG